MFQSSRKFRPAAIQELLRRDGLTQAQFARRFGVSRQLVLHWLSGRSEPQFRTVAALAAAFGVPLEFFLEPELPADRRIAQ